MESKTIYIPYIPFSEKEMADRRFPLNTYSGCYITVMLLSLLSAFVVVLVHFESLYNCVAQKGKPRRKWKTDVCLFFFFTLSQRRKSPGSQWRSCACGSGSTAWCGPCSPFWAGDVMARSLSAYPALWPGAKWKTRDSLSSWSFSPSTSPCLRSSSSAATLASPSNSISPIKRHLTPTKSPSSSSSTAGC